MKKTLYVLTLAIVGVSMMCRAGIPDNHHKIMSFNIRFDTPKDTAQYDWTARRTPIVNMVHETTPDVIGVQELLLSMTDSLYAMLPEYSHFRIAQGNGVEGRMTGDNTIFYRKNRYEATDSGYFWLSATPTEPSKPWNSTDRHYRTCLWLKLHDRQSDKDLYVFSTHFPYKKEVVDTEVRAKCSQLICDTIAAICGDNAVFVLGDLNASTITSDPRNTSLTPLVKYMHQARTEAEFTNGRSSFNGFGRVSPEIRGKNLDHIFYRNATALLFETVDYPGYGTTYISDHYPIMCHFDI